MSPRPTSKELYARYEAFSEAFEHLRMEWTECRIEIKQGNIVADRLMNEAIKWLARARYLHIRWIW